MINSLIPFVVVGYFLFFLKNNRLNNILTGLIFVSFFAFSTNYDHFGFDFYIFRYLHRSIGVLVVIALALHIFRHRVNVFKELVPRILALFVLAILLSFIGNDIDVPNYIHYVRNFIFISSIVVYLYYLIDSRAKLEELFGLIIAITVILSCFMVLEVLQNAWMSDIRKSLNFGNANYLAYALFPGFVLTVFSKKSYFMWFFAPLVIFAIFASGSRAVELSSIFVIFLYVYQRLNKKIYLIPVVIGVIAILVLFFNQIMTNKNFDLYKKSRYVLANSSNIEVRQALSKIALNIFQEHPINGIGYGQFMSKFRNYIDSDIIEMKNIEINDTLKGYQGDFPKSVLLSSMNPKRLEYEGLYISPEKMTHNDLLTVVAELGLLGIACVVFLFYKLYIELQKLLLHNRDYFFLSIGLIGSSLLFSLFHNNLTSFVFWFVLFIPFIMNRNYIKTR